MDRPLARIVWHGNSLEQVRSFSELARQDAGYQLHRVQQGLEPRDWKPMSALVAAFWSREVRMSRRKTTDVFEQIGFSPNEAAHLQLRSAMMTRLIAEIEKQGHTQAEAAKRMEITQPRVSDLMRGKLHLFSIDTLIELLAGLGLRVDLKIRRAA